MFCLQPNDVDTALGLRPRGVNSCMNDNINTIITTSLMSDLSEGVGEGDTRPLLGHHHQGADTAQPHPPGLELRHAPAQAPGAELHHAVTAECVPHLELGH